MEGFFFVMAVITGFASEYDMAAFYMAFAVFLKLEGQR